MTVRLPVPTDPSAIAVLDRQVELMLLLADDVLDGVTLDECLRRIDERSWTVHERDGAWFGELHDETPDLPAPSLGWTMWHPVWWLTTLLAHSRGESIPDADDVAWPGPDGTLPELRGLWSTWMRFVGELDERALASSDFTRFPYSDERPFVHVVGWSSMELVKNLSEMCLLRRIGADLG